MLIGLIVDVVGWLFWGFCDALTILSVISGLGSRRKPISEIEVAKPGIESKTPCSTIQELNHSTSATVVNIQTDTLLYSQCIIWHNFDFVLDVQFNIFTFMQHPLPRHFRTIDLHIDVKINFDWTIGPNISYWKYCMRLASIKRRTKVILALYFFSKKWFWLQFRFHCIFFKEMVLTSIFRFH